MIDKDRSSRRRSKGKADARRAPGWSPAAPTEPRAMRGAWEAPLGLGADAFDRAARISITAPTLEVVDARRGFLQVHHGEIVSLLGLSGSGKSRWVRSLLGLGDPFDDVRLWGKPSSKELVASLVGWVPEGDGVLLSSTVLDNVILRIGGRAMKKEQGLDALDLVGLARRANEPVVHLNRAERRRVALARCLARRAPFLVIDNELDAVLWPLFPTLCSYQPWIESVLVTQSALTSFTRQAATSVAVLHEGTVIGQGALEDLVQSADPLIHGIIGSLDQQEGQ